MSAIKSKREKQIRRHKRVRSRVKGTSARPRLSVFRSNRRLWAQLIDDTAGRTVVAASDRDISKRKKEKRITNAEQIGVLVAKRASEKKITRAVFDRGPYQYHGSVRAVAEGARKAGLKI